MNSTSKSLQPVKGMHDIHSQSAHRWLKLEAMMQEIFTAHCYDLIRTPHIESTELYLRSIGEYTDIVQKEMYSFTDQGGAQLTLRPELTASCVRALLNLGFERQLPKRLWTMGACFRRERPQKGRTRQFYQADVELFGVEEPKAESEQILMLYELFKRLGLLENLELQINSLGDIKARKTHKKALIDYFKAHRSELNEEEQNRLKHNPLRLLDSKNPQLQSLIERAPILLNYLEKECNNHFECFQSQLKSLAIPYCINARLVRGLDYYNRSVFEWVFKDNQVKPHSTITLAGGGRYDGLVSQLNPKQKNPIYAVGFAIGIERLMMAIEAVNPAIVKGEVKADIAIINNRQDSQGDAVALQIKQHLHRLNPTLKIWQSLKNNSSSKQFTQAQKTNANWLISVVDNHTQETTQKPLSIKRLDKKDNAQFVNMDEITSFFKDKVF